MAVLNFVDRINEKLNAGETLKLENIGSFQFDKHGIILYEPAKFELVDAYGLTEFTYPTINETQKLFQPRPAVRALNRRKDIVKIAASVTLLLALSLYPVKNGRQTLQSIILPTELLNEELPIPVEKQIQNEIKVEPSQAELKPYILVGGSFESFENAAQMQHALVSEGFHSEISELESGLHRVIIDSYSNKTEAIAAMKTYRTKYKDSGAWVSTR